MSTSLSAQSRKSNKVRRIKNRLYYYVTEYDRSPLNIDCPRCQDPKIYKAPYSDQRYDKVILVTENKQTKRDDQRVLVRNEWHMINGPECGRFYDDYTPCWQDHIVVLQKPQAKGPEFDLPRDKMLGSSVPATFLPMNPHDPQMETEVCSSTRPHVPREEGWPWSYEAIVYAETSEDGVVVRREILKGHRWPTDEDAREEADTIRKEVERLLEERGDIPKRGAQDVYVDNIMEIDAFAL